MPKTRIFKRRQLAVKRFQKRLARQRKVYQTQLEREWRAQKHAEKALERLKRELGGKITAESILDAYLPENTTYLLSCNDSPFSKSRIKSITPWKTTVFKVPAQFSLLDNAETSFEFLQQVIYALLFGNKKKLEFDYEECTDLDIGAQVFLDVIIQDVIVFYNRCAKKSILRETAGVLKPVGLTNIRQTSKTNEPVLKVLYSVGSPAIHSKRPLNFDEIIPYYLCKYSLGETTEDLEEQRNAIDTTTMVQYVRRCLRRVNKDLRPTERMDLGNIISEILINAEEHSTVGTRYSIGYFRDEERNGRRGGEFRLVILNLGQTIYEKFADPNCPNKHIVEVMKTYSKDYTARGFMSAGEFEEETLWTLYSLQEGVTSVSPEEFSHRGTGSIQFIKSFFNLNGDNDLNAFGSRLNILSGHTWILFDGTYKIVERTNENGTFSYMTFNSTGDIADKPDKNFVQHVPNYFPGTIISARIWLDEEKLSNVHG